VKLAKTAAKPGPFWQLKTDLRRPAVPFEGEQRALLSCDVSLDGLTVAAGTELRGDDALIVYWCACSTLYYHPNE
jgi:hypothetical protein